MWGSDNEMSSFDGKTFQERGEQGKNSPSWDDNDIIVIKKVPGGDLNVIQRIGADVQRLAMPISCTAAEYADLRSVRGTTGSLADWSDDDTDAFLEKIAPRIEVKPGEDLYWTTLHFIKR